MDLLVIGGGTAGLTAAAWTVAHGGSAVVVERAEVLGGSGRFAEYLHTAPSVEELRSADPGALAHMQERLVAGFDEATRWVSSLGAGDFSAPVQVYKITRGNPMDTNRYILECAKLIGAEHLHLGATVEDLVVDDGRVRGAHVTTAEGARLEIPADSTLLATGGIQRDPELAARYIHPNAALAPVIGNAVSRGDGLRLGMSVGGVCGPAGARFYGHLVPAGVTFDDPADALTVSQGHSTHGFLFNSIGERFVDETVNDHASAVACVEQPGAHALLVIDARVREQWMLRSTFGREPTDRFALALKRGARAAIADDLDDFPYMPEEWGYAGATIGENIRDLNAALAAGATVHPSREHDADPLVDPPYYVMDVVPGITFSYAGLLVDADAHVLDEHGARIPGLLAAGADAGGTCAREYAGGLANAIVFGITAASSALS